MPAARLRFVNQPGGGHATVAAPAIPPCEPAMSPPRRALAPAHAWPARLAWGRMRRAVQASPRPWPWLPKEVTDIAWKAQLRLNAKFKRLTARRVIKNKAVVAVARELRWPGALARVSA